MTEETKKTIRAIMPPEECMALVWVQAVIAAWFHIWFVYPLAIVGIWMLWYTWKQNR